MTQEYILRAMAKNYAGGHSWDHLDGEACVKAADEIKRLREDYEFLTESWHRVMKNKLASDDEIRRLLDSIFPD